VKYGGAKELQGESVDYTVLISDVIDFILHLHIDILSSFLRFCAQLHCRCTIQCDISRMGPALYLEDEGQHKVKSMMIIGSRLKAFFSGLIITKTFSNDITIKLK